MSIFAAGEVSGPAPILVRTPRGAVECAVSGDGLPVLALHGGMGGHDQSWLLARALLGDHDRHRIVAVSRPGYLGTDLAAGRSPDEQADLCAALLDELGIGAVAVAAVSAGGPAALSFARRHPARCRSLILVSTCTGRLDVPPDILSRLRLMRALARVPGLPWLMRRRMLRDPEAAARRSIPDAALRARTLADPEAGPLLRALQSGIFDRLADRLPGTIHDTMLFAGGDVPAIGPVAARTLIVHGTADPVVPVSHAEAVRRRVPGAEFLAIEGGGHVVLFTDLRRVREAAAPFLAE